MNRAILAGLTALVCALASAPRAATLASEPAAERARSTVWDLKTTAQAGQLSVYNTDREGTLFGEPVAGGDLNGDGYDEVILAPFYAPSGATNAKLAGGKLHIYFGGPDMLDGRVIDAAAPPEDAVQVWGARGGDFLGTWVDVVDVTGDGLGDLLAGAQNADGFDASTSRSQAGALYVIPGRTEWTTPMNLAEPGSLGIVQILGARPGDRMGFWAAGGDVNGDGVNDILVSADLVPSRTGAGLARGALYVIPGGDHLPERIDLGDAAQVRDLDITTIYGVDDGDHFGSCITSADFDGDGFDDVAVSSGLNRAGAAFTGYGEVGGGLGAGGGDGPNDDRDDAGEVYVIYGRADWPATIELSPSTPEAAIYYGQSDNDFFGEDLHAGDVDGDGIPDLAVGALLADAPGRSGSGVGYILWGSRMSRGERLDLAAAPDTPKVTKIYGERSGDLGADSLRLVDVDADGFADVLFGSPTFSPPGRDSAGDLKVIFGAAEGLPRVIDLADPPESVPVFQLLPPDPGDLFTYSLASADVDGDGFRDLLPNAMGGDGLGNRHDTAGEAYVVSGREFSARAGRGGAGAPCLTRVEVSPEQSRYYAGQEGITLRLLCAEGGSFEPGAVSVVNGVEVPAEFVSAGELLVRLDDAPEARNRPGQLVAQARNPGSGASPAVLSVQLFGPSITKVKAKSGGTGVTLKIKGKDFLPGATVEILDASGEEVAVAAAVRSSAKKVTARLEPGAASRGDVLTVRVINPGPAPSEPATATVK